MRIDIMIDLFSALCMALGVILVESDRVSGDVVSRYHTQAFLIPEPNIVTIRDPSP